ncbi:MAG: hypothetical protein ACM3O7_02465 [Acidobacteriota bacterium]
MRERGFSNTTTVVLAALAALLVAPLLMNWIVVDVDTTGRDAVHLKLPLPLAMVRTILVMSPEAEISATMPHDLAQHRGQVLAALQALEDGPDAALISVTSPDANVKVAKEGGLLVVDVDAPDSVVHCRIPLQAVRHALEQWDWQRAHPRLLVDFLAGSAPGELVAVRTPDATVRVTKW